MKNFQNWLDCQLYNSHLKNLTKIKQQSLYMRSASVNRRLPSTPHNCRNITNIDSFEGVNESRSRPHNIKAEMKQTQIMQENWNLANRLINVSSVISRSKQIESYRRYQSLFRKSSNNKRIDFYKADKLKKFMKMNQENFIKGVHKAILKIKITSIPRVPQSQSPTLWVELYSGTQKVTSSHYSIETIHNTEIKLPLKRKVDRNLILRLHCSRGLNYISLGDYYFEAPKKQAREYTDLMSQEDSRKLISFSVEVEELNKYEKYNSLHLR